uniref:ATPase subunit 8 n=1 Tax=Botrylloides giganteus TaxID=2034436 RepID=A0A024GX33_9ASCI|nr:ATP synthase F0 subunit 8 [Botrylloides giganteus]CCO25720.1 ATPase subunit 8 [Botrylloides giganteus]CDM98948.1 ATPase subunit 8 [Botrylloides giganteus]
MPQLNFLSFFFEFICFLLMFFFVTELFKQDSL